MSRRQAKRASFAANEKAWRHYKAAVRSGLVQPPRVRAGLAVSEESLLLLEQYLHPRHWEVDTKYDGDPSMPGPRRVLLDASVALELLELDADVNAAIKKKAEQLEQQRGTPKGDEMEAAFDRLKKEGGPT